MRLPLKESVKYVFSLAIVMHKRSVHVSFTCLKWLNSLNHGTLYFFRHRVFILNM